MSSKGNSQPLKEMKTSWSKAFRDPNLLKEKYLLKNRKGKSSLTNHLTSRHHVNVNTKERDDYKSYVLDKLDLQKATTSFASPKHPLDDVICLDSDSDDDVKITKPKAIVLDDDSSDSDDIKIVHKDFRTKPKAIVLDDSSDSDDVKIVHKDFRTSCNYDNKRSSLFDEHSFKDLHIKDVIETEDVIDIEDDSDIEEVKSLPTITAEQIKQLDLALLLPGQTNLITKFGITITPNLLKCLSGTVWLNDNIINFYLKLIAERSTSSKLKVYSMDTYMLMKVFIGGHESVKRWTRKVDIFSYDLVLIPYNQGEVHWCLIVINMKEKTISYYDSLGASDEQVLEVVLRYLFDEYRDKKQKRLPLIEWTTINVENVPQQMNGSDCGVFTCTIAEFLCRQSKLTFTQKDMPYFRRKISIEILKGKLLT